MEDTTQAPQPTMDPSFNTSSLERRPSDEDPAAMTIEFLRARLLSERSVSKAARQRAQQLAKKVVELEQRLESEIQLQKKLKAARLEVLSKYRAELSAEYGEFFASSFGEGGFARFPREESLTEPLRPGSHNINEGFLQYTPDEDDEGLSSSRTDQDHLDRSDSSRQLNHEEANEDDEETDHSGRQKGILAWGSRKGSRKLHDKEFGYGTDWLGRSISQRSFACADGESPRKRWVGKSVRQIRKKESRPYDTNFEDEPGQTQDPEDIDGKISHPDGIKESLQCEDERDTEVERVLERQAELIEQFEAEENAQRAWEAKFKEQKALSNNETAEGISQSDAGSMAETVADEQSVKEVVWPKGDVAKVVEAEPSQLVNEVSIGYLRKVHPDDCHSGGPDAMQDVLVQSQTFQETMLENVSGAESWGGGAVLNTTAESEASSDANQRTIGNIAPKEKLPEERLSGIDEESEHKETVESVSDMPAEIDLPDKVPRVQASQSSVDTSSEILEEEVSQCQVSTLTNIEEREEHARDSFVEAGKPDRYRKHLSSSFRFAVFADAEPVTSSPPQMPGFAAYKQDADVAEQYRDIQKEVVVLKGDWDNSTRLITASEQPVGFGVNQAGLQHLNHHVSTTTSNEHGISVGLPVASDNSTLSRQDTGLQEESRANVLEGLVRREGQSSLVSENGPVGGFSSHASSDNLIKDPLWEEALNRRTRLQGGQDLNPGLTKTIADFPPHLEFRTQQMQYASPNRDRPNFNSFSLLPAGNRSGIPVPMPRLNAYEDTAFRNHPKSVDGGFDRVADVLRALQIAKHQVQTSNEEATLLAGLDAAYRSGYNGRDAFYIESSCVPPVYLAPRQYVSPAPYSSRGPSPFIPDMQGWGAPAGGYGVGSPRQISNAPYARYASRMTEPRNLWLPPPPPMSPQPPQPQPQPQGVHYHYDTRQHR